MRSIKLMSVVGARPNFMKVLPLVREFEKVQGLRHQLLHTGQHYDELLSDAFFRDLELPKPDFYLGAGSGSHAEQTAKIMVESEKVLLNEKPDAVIVVGDVNSSMAVSIAASKLQIPIVHVEAGLRSFDRSMPEEINRLVTDALSSFLFTTCRDADKNLVREGVPEDQIFFVGNVMIDTLLLFRGKSERSKILDALDLVSKNYGLLTLHRPSNVDGREALGGIVTALDRLQREIPLVFAVHPRTRKMIRTFGYEEQLTGMKNLILTDPLGYLDFLKLTCHAKMILTDSGGLQEESTFLGVPCLTLRENTERPITVRQGTNRLVGNDPEKILAGALEILRNGYPKKSGAVPELWDGKAAGRITEVLTSNVA
jgi:UDP-N-acetylglucosamine 2-epimerase (non-hydrolysing)